MTHRKTLHIVTQLELGGAQCSTLELLARLDRREYAPTLLSSDGLLTEAARAIPGLSVVLMPSLRRAIDPLADAWTLGRLASFIRQGGYDIVHTHSSKAGILGRWAAARARTPVIVHTVHGFGFHAFQPPWVRGFYQALERRAAQVTDGLIVVSERDQQTALRLGLGQPEQVRLIRYGIEAGRFQVNGVPAAQRRRAVGLAADRPVVGTVACLKPQKAPLDFVKACHRIHSRVPDAQFVMVGDGVLRSAVERLRRRLGLEDCLHLFGWRQDIPALLAAMDVFMLSSRWEGLPIACLEARATGLPIVATAAGGTAEIVAHERHGLVVPVAAPESMGDAVVRLLRDAAARAWMGEQSRASLDGEFTVDGMVGQTEAFYEELLRAREA